MTGLRNCSRGSSFGNESRTALKTISREKTLERLALVTEVGGASVGAAGDGAAVVDI